MDQKEYQKAASRTYTGAKEIYPHTMDLLHCVIGIVTEAAELADALKKHIYYGKPLDTVNMKEEMGDVEWYMGNLYRLLGADRREVLATNIAKLKARYPEKFTTENALNRDLDVERKILEGDNGTVGKGCEHDNDSDGNCGFHPNGCPPIFVYNRSDSHPFTFGNEYKQVSTFNGWPTVINDEGKSESLSPLFLMTHFKIKE